MSLKRLLPRYDTSRFTKAERPMAPIWTPLRRPPAKTTRGSCRQTSITTRRTFSVSDSRGRRGIGPLCPGSDNRLWSRQPDESWDVDCRLCRHLKGTRPPAEVSGHGEDLWDLISNHVGRNSRQGDHVGESASRGNWPLDALKSSVILGSVSAVN